MGTTGEKKKRTFKKNVDGRSTSSHDNKKYRNRSMEKQRGMAFGFRKTATAVIKPDGWMDDLYQRLQLQFYVLLIMGAMDARNNVE